MTGKSTSRKTRAGSAGGRGSALMVRLDAESKGALAEAAALRGVSISDYVRQVTVTQARREVRSARDRTIVLTPDEQLAFWNALQAAVTLTPAQRELAGLMRGLRKQTNQEQS